MKSYVSVAYSTTNKKLLKTEYAYRHENNPVQSFAYAICEGIFLRWLPRSATIFNDVLDVKTVCSLLYAYLNFFDTYVILRDSHVVLSLSEAHTTGSCQL